jgi:hypothetical protein
VPFVEPVEHLRGARHQLPGAEVDDVQFLFDPEGQVGAGRRQGALLARDLE